MEISRKKVMVGMSGGVDSSVAALLLIRRGYEVAGATFRLWPQEETDAPDVLDAKAVCDNLGIPHHVLDLRDAFREHVVDKFAASYLRGETPNPCVTCNKRIKFGLFPDLARKAGYDYIATGHYANVSRDISRGIFRLKRGSHSKKDQSYVLYHLTQEQLSYCLFPLGPLTKEEVRRIASESGLPVHSKAESQDICFVPNGDYPDFLESYLNKPFHSGNFIDAKGKVIGVHRGIGRYTIGQRKGLGISLGTPAFVTKIDAVANTVTLSDDSALWSNTLTAGNVSWIESPHTGQPIRCQVKIRYAHEAESATLFLLDSGCVRVEFDKPQRAITPGQSTVFYDGDFVLGGGVIGACGDYEWGSAPNP